MRPCITVSSIDGKALLLVVHALPIGSSKHIRNQVHLRQEAASGPRKQQKWCAARQSAVLVHWSSTHGAACICLT